MPHKIRLWQQQGLEKEEDEILIAPEATKQRRKIYYVYDARHCQNALKLETDGSDQEIEAAEWAVRESESDGRYALCKRFEAQETAVEAKYAKLR